MNAPFLMFFDVESVGLHGEGFQVGYCVFNQERQKVEEGWFGCDPLTAMGNGDDREWVVSNVPILRPDTCVNPKQVRSDFWEVWKKWKEQGAMLVADCAWPVEARFLNQCIDDDSSRIWEGPYPLHEMASVLCVNGINPLTTFPREKDELPQHDALNDARQSARVYFTVCNGDLPLKTIL